MAAGLGGIEREDLGGVGDGLCRSGSDRPVGLGSEWGKKKEGSENEKSEQIYGNQALEIPAKVLDSGSVATENARRSAASTVKCVSAMSDRLLLFVSV